jgi:hypothetical protein
MCKKLVLLSLMLSLASASYAADTVIGNWEGVMDGFVVQGTGTLPDYSYDTGVTLGTSALKFQTAAGFSWDLYNGGLYGTAAQAAFSAPGARLKMDVTWVASEWVGTGIWAKLDAVAINSNPGWSQWTPIDTANPSYPGSWDPYFWGAVHTRTLTFNTAAYNWAGVAGSWWLQLNIATNCGGDAGFTPGKLYIDNVRITP